MKHSSQCSAFGVQLFRVLAVVALGLSTLCAPLAAQTIYRLDGNDIIEVSALTQTNANNILTGVNANATGTLNWARVSKTGSSLADLTTRNFADLQSKPTTLSGYGITDGQPLDSDLTAIAALATTTFGRSLLALADASALRTAGGLVIGTDVQAYDVDLAAWALVNPSSYSTTAQIAAAYQPLAASLTSWAAITRAAGFDTFVATPSSANLAALLTNETGSGAAVFATSPTFTGPSSARSASATASLANSYLNLGASENLVSSYRLMWFGYNPGGNTYAPAYFGYQETANNNQTSGDLVWGVRSVQTDTQPTEAMRLRPAGLKVVSTGTNPTLLTGASSQEYGVVTEDSSTSSAAYSKLLFATNRAGTRQISGGIGVYNTATNSGVMDIALNSSATNAYLSEVVATLRVNGSSLGNQFFNTTPSTSTTTGSLTTAGGLGVAGAGFFGSDLNVVNSTSALLKLDQSGTRSWTFTATSGALFLGTSSSGGTWNVNAQVATTAFKSTTASSSTTDGAVTVSGGLGVAGAINGGTNITANGASTDVWIGAAMTGTNARSWQWRIDSATGNLRLFDATGSAYPITIGGATSSITLGGQFIGPTTLNTQSYSVHRFQTGSVDKLTVADTVITVGTTTEATTGGAGALVVTNGGGYFGKRIYAAGGYLGTTTNDNAPTGGIGELVSSAIATGSAVALTISTPANVTSISLTAGDWDVSGHVNFKDGGPTGTPSFKASISSISATHSTDGSEASTNMASNTVVTATPSRKRVSLSATTTIYLVAEHTAGGAGGPSAYGVITARRVR